jgi:threonine dehydrogenase-like Zn-dependent dehydrogenase
MDAIVVSRDDRQPRVVDRPRPDPSPGEALVRTLRVGVDATDHEVIAGGHGGFPAGDDHLVLGHEAVGVVEDANDTGLEDGQVVVPTVRRPADGTSERGEEPSDPDDEPSGHFQRGQPDMAKPGEYVERGISGAHGFMAEYFISPAEYLVPVPEDLADVGFLVEPVSVAEKAIELADASRSTFDWRPESALVLGNGSLGLLALAMLGADERFERTYCLGRRDRPDPTIDVIERLGATYVDSRETPVPEIPDAYESADLVFEATGHAKHAFETVEVLAPNGVGALLGVPEAGWDFEVPGSDLHRELVLQNKALVGSVNSSVAHFAAAVETLAGLPDWLLDDLVTGVFGLADVERAFQTDETTIKTAVQFHTR